MKEDKDNFLVAVEKAKQRLAAGEKPEDVFDWRGDFHDGFAAVVLNDKDNYINIDGELLSTTWFDWGSDFHGGFAVVTLNGKDYCLRKDGVLCDFDTKEPVVEKPVAEEPDRLVSLNKACEWLKENAADYMKSYHDAFGEGSEYNSEDLIEDFMKAMEE